MADLNRRGLLRMLSLIPVVGAFSRWPRRERILVEEGGDFFDEDDPEWLGCGDPSVFADFADFVRATGPSYLSSWEDLIREHYL
jgi:hypothetical protein